MEHVYAGHCCEIVCFKILIAQLFSVVSFTQRWLCRLIERTSTAV